MTGFVRTFPGDDQGVDRNMRKLTRDVPALDKRLAAIELKPAPTPTETPALKFTSPLTTLADESIGLTIVIDDGGLNNALQVDANTGGLYLVQGVAVADAAVTLASALTQINALLASLRATGIVKT